MLGECLEIFRSYTEEERENEILKNYIPKDGTYILVMENGEAFVADIKLDKKTGQMSKSAGGYEDFCYYDYHSNLVSMNKPLDTNKVIHSNNYLSFFVKKESILNGKLTKDIVDEYYDILKNMGRRRLCLFMKIWKRKLGRWMQKFYKETGSGFLTISFV